jgi:hypothetical protein
MAVLMWPLLEVLRAAVLLLVAAMQKHCLCYLQESTASW